MAMYPPYDDPNDPNPRWSTPAPPDPAPGPGEPTPDQPQAANETPVLPQTRPVQQTGAPSKPPTQASLKQLDVFRDPEFLQRAAQIALDNGDDDGLKWLQHVHTALNENAIEALGKLRAGDGEGAVEAFNRSGIHRDAKSATKNSDGTWTLTTVDGRSMNIDPEQEERGLMSPLEYAKVQSERAQIKEREAHAGYWKAAGNFKEAQDSMLRDIAAVKASSALEVQRLRNQVAHGNMSLAAAEEKYDMQYGPQATFNTFLKSAQAANDEHPFTTAARATIESGAVIAKPNPDTGEIYLINARRPDQMWKVLPDAAAYKAITGADLYIPKGERRAPVTPPAASKPGNAPPAAPVAPKAAAAGLTRPGGAEGFEGASSSAAPEQAYFGSRTQSSQDLRARFDVDAKTLSKRELFAKYGGLRSALRPDQLQRLQ
jgi:hypothetical protein